MFFKTKNTNPKRSVYTPAAARIRTFEFELSCVSIDDILDVRDGCPYRLVQNANLALEPFDLAALFDYLRRKL